MSKNFVLWLFVFLCSWFFAAMLNSCHTAQVATNSTDSVYIERHDTIIRGVHDTVRTASPCHDTTYIVRNGTASAVVRIKRDTVYIQANCDGQDKIITGLIEKYNRDKTIVLTKQTKYIPKVYKWALWNALFFDALVISLLLYRLKKVL